MNVYVVMQCIANFPIILLGYLLGVYVRLRPLFEICIKQ